MADSSQKADKYKDAAMIGAFIGFIFLISFAAHLLYIKGYAFDIALNAHGKNTISIFGSQKECETATGGECVLQLCNDIPAGKEFEDICGQGYKEGWYPKHSGQ